MFIGSFRVLALCPSFKFSFSWYNIRKRRIPVLVNSSFEQRNFMGTNSYVMRLCMHHWTTVLCPSMKHSMVTLSVERYPERKWEKMQCFPRDSSSITRTRLQSPYIIADLTTSSRVPWSYPFMDLVIPQPRKTWIPFLNREKEESGREEGVPGYALWGTKEVSQTITHSSYLRYLFASHLGNPELSHRNLSHLSQRKGRQDPHSARFYLRIQLWLSNLTSFSAPFSYPDLGWTT